MTSYYIVYMITHFSYLLQRTAPPTPYHVTYSHLDNVEHPLHPSHHQMYSDMSQGLP